MAVAHRPPAVELREPATAWRMSLERYHALVDAAIIPDGDRVELIEGVLVAMASKGPNHDYAVDWLTETFILALAGRVRTRIQSAVTFPPLGSELEPDLAVVALDDPRPRHPSEPLLIVEVAISSLRYDREVKAPLYARAGVPEYWIVDLIGRTVERHTEPGPEGYATTERFPAGATLTPLALGAPTVDVTALLDFALTR